MLNWGIISAHRKSQHWGHPQICWFLYLDWITTQGYHRFSFIPEISRRYPKSPTGTVASPAVQIHLLKCYKDLFRRVFLRPQIGVQHLIHGICCKYQTSLLLLTSDHQSWVSLCINQSQKKIYIYINMFKQSIIQQIMKSHKIIYIDWPYLTQPILLSLRKA